MKIGVYAGTFDPLTLGHWSIIQAGINLFDKLIIGIGSNPNKKPLFTDEERRDMVLECIAESGYSKMDVEVFKDEFLVKFAERKGATHILRGLRDQEDFRQEAAYNFFNKSFAPNIETVFVMSDPKVAAVSSSAIKGMIGPDGWEAFVRPYVHAVVFKKLKEKWNS